MACLLLHVNLLFKTWQNRRIEIPASLRSLPLLLSKSPLYKSHGLASNQDHTENLNIPSIVGIGLPLSSKSFCVDPSR